MKNEVGINLQLCLHLIRQVTHFFIKKNCAWTLKFFLKKKTIKLERDEKKRQLDEIHVQVHMGIFVNQANQTPHPLPPILEKEFFGGTR